MALEGVAFLKKSAQKGDKYGLKRGGEPEESKRNEKEVQYRFQNSGKLVSCRIKLRQCRKFSEQTFQEPVGTTSSKRFVFASLTILKFPPCATHLQHNVNIYLISE